MSVRGATLWSMTGQFLSFIVQFFTSVIIARFYLGPSEVGVFALGLSVALTVQALQDFGLVRFISSVASLSKEEVDGCSAIAIVGGVLIAAVIVFMAKPASLFFRAPDLMWILFIIAGALFISSLNVVPLALLQRELRFREISVINIVTMVVYAGVAIGLAQSGYSYFSLAWGVVAQQTAKTAMALWCKFEFPHRWVRLHEIRQVVQFGTQISVLNIIWQVSVRSPEIVIGRMQGIAAVGLYTRASSLTEQLRALFGNALGAVMLPAFARLRDSAGDGGRQYERVVACYTAIIWPAMALLCIFAEPTIRFLFGERWIGVVPLFQFITLAQIVHSALPLHNELPLVHGKIRKLIFISLMDMSASIIVLALMAGISLEAAAASRPIYAVIWYFLYYGFLKGIIGFQPARLNANYAKSVALALATILPGLLAIIAAQGTDRLTIPAVIVSGCLGAMLWAAGARTLQHPIYYEIMEVARAARATFLRTI